MSALNTGDIAVAEGVQGVKEMVKKGRMRYVVACSGWPGCVAHWPVGGVGEGADFFVSPKNKKKETGVQTQLIARADIYLTLEAVVDTPPPTSHPTNKSRKTLRAEMWARAQRMGSVDTLLAPTNDSSTINTTNKQKNRKTLRTKMYARAQRRETDTERQIAKLKRRRRWGLAAAAVVVGGYFWGGAGEAVRGVLQGEKMKEVLGAGEKVREVLEGEDSTVWRRGVWVEEMRRVVMGIGGRGGG